VSNAGVIDFEAASMVSKTSYDKTFAVNVLAPMLVVSALRDKIQKATIVSVSSVSDRFPESEVALYSSSKAANTVYFDALADDLKQARVYTLLPDYTDTPMQHGMNDDNPNFDWSVTIKPEDMASFTMRLINDELSVESGANIIIVTEKLKEDLKNIERLYGFNTDTGKLTTLSQ
jgi:NAD(P)-dependent dehydrogenase (short-subunit alcohol dehydrogenase family)